MSLIQSEIVSAGIALLDDGGLGAVTLRAVASRLGVSAPTLYWHIRGKRHLLDLMAEAIFSSSVPANLVEPSPGQGWSDWLAERYRSMRLGLLSHRDGALVVAGNRPTPASLPHIEKLLAAMVREGFSPTEALMTIIALGSYTIGDALETQSSAAREPEEATELQSIKGAVFSGTLPTLAQAVRGYATPEERFEYGLMLLLEGVRGRMASQVGNSGSAG